MGTRADFYVGKGKDAEWIGSIAWDGYRDGLPDTILDARSERNFREGVIEFLKSREDATFPERGWPWPWDDSGTTDCSYWFFDGECWDCAPGDFYFPCRRPESDYDDPAVFEGRERVEFPDMSSRKNVTLGKRSGAIVLGG